MCLSTLRHSGDPTYVPAPKYPSSHKKPQAGAVNLSAVQQIAAKLFVFNLQEGIACVNASIRTSFNQFKLADYADHIARTRKGILDGCKGLSGRLIVFGPGLIEPWKELFQQFKEIVVVDIDETNLKHIAAIAPSVICKKIDLTDGLYQRIQAIVDKQIKGIPLKDIIGEIIKEYESYGKSNITVLNQFDGLGEFDFAISSLVTTQLFGQPDQLLQEHLKRCKFSFTDDMPLKSTYRDAVENLKSKLILKHFMQLFSLLKDSGSCYYADTPAQITIGHSSGDGPVCMQVLPMSFVDTTLKMYFKIAKREKWVWPYASEFKLGFRVEAWNLTKLSILEQSALIVQFKEKATAAAPAGKGIKTQNAKASTQGTATAAAGTAAAAKKG